MSLRRITGCHWFSISISTAAILMTSQRWRNAREKVKFCIFVCARAFEPAWWRTSVAFILTEEEEKGNFWFHFFSKTITRHWRSAIATLYMHIQLLDTRTHGQHAWQHLLAHRAHQLWLLVFARNLNTTIQNDVSCVCICRSNQPKLVINNSNIK